MKAARPVKNETMKPCKMMCVSWFMSWRPLLSLCLFFSPCLSDPLVSPSPVCVFCAWLWLTLSCMKHQVILLPLINHSIKPLDLQPLIARSYFQPEQYLSLDPGPLMFSIILSWKLLVQPSWPVVFLCHSCLSLFTCLFTCLPACLPINCSCLLVFEFSPFACLSVLRLSPVSAVSLPPKN